MARLLFDLIPGSDTLVVDVEAGEVVAATTVKYVKDAEWMLVHRLNQDDWTAVAIPMTGSTDASLTQGSFSTLPLAPGSTYQAAIVPADYSPDPSQPPNDWIVQYGDHEGPPEFATVIAIRKAPEVGDFFSDSNLRRHGTYFVYDIMTKEPVVAHVSVATVKPVDLGDGRLAFPLPTSAQVNGPKTGFSFDLTGLVPGTTYHTLLLLVDEFGNWQYVEDGATTLSRVVEASLEALWVVDDDDTLTGGEASFKFHLHTGNGPDRSSKIHYDNKNLDSGHWARPDPSGTLTLGPYSARTSDPFVYFCVTAESDNGGSLQANSVAFGQREIECPVGSGERVSGRKAAVQARDVGGQSFEFRVHYNYSVRYL